MMITSAGQIFFLVWYESFSALIDAKLIGMVCVLS